MSTRPKKLLVAGIACLIVGVAALCWIGVVRGCFVIKGWPSR